MKIFKAAYLQHFCNWNILPFFAFLNNLNIPKIAAAREINAAVVDISGRQRTLSQRLALLCLQLVLTNAQNERDTPTKLLDARKQLREVAALMEKSHHALINGDGNMKLSGNMSELQAIYFKPPFRLDWQVRNYLAEIEALLNFDSAELTLDNTHLCYILNAVENDLLAGLDAAIAEYQKESDLEQLAIYLYLLELHSKSKEAATIAQEKAEEYCKALLELQQAQPQLIHAEKMSSLGQVVAGIAHEINNPVNFIIGNLYYAEDYINRLLQLVKLYQQEYRNPTPLIQQYLEIMEFDYLIEDFPKVLASMQVGAERISQIVLTLLNFSSSNRGEKKLVDIHDAIENTLLIMENNLKASGTYREITVVRDYGCLPRIECYPQELNQVFMNIIKNAIDTLQETTVKNPQIRICTYMVAGNASRSKGGHSIAVRIADNGSGMPETIRTRIFDPFFTTKDVGKGTGLGLAISYQIIVEKHGGTIGCTSVPGEGTEFSIEIPLQKSFFAFDSNSAFMNV